MQWKSSATPYRGLVYTNHRPMEAIILICWSSIEPLSSFRSRIIKVAHRREQARSPARRVRAGVALELSQNCARATGLGTNISRFFPVETSSSFRVSSAVGSAHVREAIRRKELGFDRSRPTWPTRERERELERKEGCRLIAANYAFLLLPRTAKKRVRAAGWLEPSNSLVFISSVSSVLFFSSPFFLSIPLKKNSH